MNSVSKNVNGINITVDYRTELLGVLMLIGDYRKKFPHLFINYDNKFYVDSIINRFEKYKDDDVVKMFDQIVEAHSFNYDAPFCLFLQLDNELNINLLDDYTFINRLQSDNKIYVFIKKLNDFAKRIDFQKFYRNNRKLYEEWINNISGAFQKYEILKFLNEYYGYLSESNFVVDINAFTTNGAYGCNLDNKVVCCYPVFEEMKKNKLFDSEAKEIYILETIIHEFSHGYVNSITDKYNILNKNTNLFDNIRDEMIKQAYPYDSHIINEHIVRAISARYIYLVYGDKELYKQCIENNKKSGFIYIDNIIDSLINYENNRDKYKTLVEFYPEIIENIKKYIKK